MSEMDGGGMAHKPGRRKKGMRQIASKRQPGPRNPWKMKVLLIEDYPQHRDMCKNALEASEKRKREYKVYTVSNTSEALFMLRPNVLHSTPERLDLIVVNFVPLDHLSMRGDAFIKTLRALGIRVPAVVTYLTKREITRSKPSPGSYALAEKGSFYAFETTRVQVIKTAMRRAKLKPQEPKTDAKKPAEPESTKKIIEDAKRHTEEASSLAAEISKLLNEDERHRRSQRGINDQSNTDSGNQAQDNQSTDGKSDGVSDA